MIRSTLGQLRFFTSSDPMRRDNRRIQPQSDDARRHLAHIRQRQAERACAQAAKR